MHAHDVYYAAAQIRWLMFEFWLGCGMMAVGFTGITTLAFSLLRRDRNGQN